MGHETLEPKTKSLKEIEEVIARAIKKVGARRENDICRYIPMNSGGYMHHFTLKKMKTKQPQELGEMIEKFIINKDHPGTVAPKTRAARGSSKKRDHITFTRNQLERMLAIAKLAGDNEMIDILKPKKSLATIKRELIASIRQNKVDPDLWSSYNEAVNLQHTIQSNDLYNNFSKS